MATCFALIEGNTFMLRALGGDPDGRIHYTVIKENKRVLLYLQVNPETELIHVLNKTSPEEYLPTGVQYIATGGLKNIESEMIIEKITGEPIANINHKGIQLRTAGDFADHPLSFSYRYDSERKEQIVEITYTTARSTFNEALIRGYKKGSLLNITFRLAVTPLQRLVSVLASIKLYYCFFNYSSLPIPKQIPALMPKNLQTLDISEILRCTNDFRLRASCESETGNRYVDLLDENTRLVLMVAETGANHRLPALFFDTFGVRKYCLQDPVDELAGSRIVHVYNSDGKEIGMSDNQKYYDDQSQVVATKEILGKRMRIYQVNERTRLAVAVDTDESSSVLINFYQKLDVKLKILIIADVLAYSYRVWAFLKITLPVFRRYPFREPLP